MYLREGNWEAPPTRLQGPGKNAELVSMLRSNSGRWRKLGENIPTSRGSNLRRKYPEVEVQYHTAGKNYEVGRADIYVRWNPESAIPER